MATAAELLKDLLHTADERLLAGWYRTISVPATGVRRQLRSAGLRYVDPATRGADMVELDRSARWVIEQSGFGASALGGLAGLGGIASVPPEVVADLVRSIRLGQRLCVVYGFDPATDRGQMALFRALAAGYEVELPDNGPVGMRVSEIPGLLLPALAARPTVPGALVGEVVRKSAWTLATRLSRVVPVLSAGSNAWTSKRDAHARGLRMQAVLRRMSELRQIGRIEEAVEIPAASAS